MINEIDLLAITPQCSIHKSLKVYSHPICEFINFAMIKTYTYVHVLSA